MPYFKNTFLSIFSIFFASSIASFPCPFNPYVCNCTAIDSNEHRSFQSVYCESSEFPLFDIPSDPRYETEMLKIKSDYVFNLSALQFTAFRKIGDLILEQNCEFRSANQQWNPFAFETMAVTKSIQIQGLAGIVPLPLALRRLGARNELQSLHIEDSDQMIDIPNSAFQDFSSLNCLTISNIPIGKFDDDAFRGLDRLEKLVIDNAGLDSWPISINKLPRLNSLYLTDNKINGIPREFRPDELQNLYRLRLQNNNLSQAITNGAFDFHFPSLKYFDLNGNGLTSVPKNIFAHNHQLFDVSLEDNQIQTIRKGDLEFSATMGYLRLSNNPISEIEMGAFENMEIVRVFMTNVSLSSLDLATFYGAGGWYSEWHLDDNERLEILSVSSMEKFPPHAIFSIKNSGLELIDASFSDLLAAHRGVSLDISHNKNLLCQINMTWMSYFVFCTNQLIIRNSTCADLEDQSLEDFLRSEVPDPCQITTTTAAVETTITTSVGTGTTTTVASPSTSHETRPVTTTTTTVGTDSTSSDGTTPKGTETAGSTASSPISVATSPSKGTASRLFSWSVFSTISAAAIFFVLLQAVLTDYDIIKW